MRISAGWTPRPGIAGTKAVFHESWVAAVNRFPKQLKWRSPAVYERICVPRASPTSLHKLWAFSAAGFKPPCRKHSWVRLPLPAWLSNTPAEVSGFEIVFPYPATLFSWPGQPAPPKRSICHQGLNGLKIKGIWLHSGALASHWAPSPSSQPSGTMAKRLEEAPKNDEIWLRRPLKGRGSQHKDKKLKISQPTFCPKRPLILELW